MKTKEEGRGDFWLWCAIDPDTKLVLSFSIGRRTRNFGEDFVNDVAKRVRPGVQIATDAFSRRLNYHNETAPTPVSPRDRG